MRNQTAHPNGEPISAVQRLPATPVGTPSPGSSRTSSTASLHEDAVDDGAEANLEVKLEAVVEPRPNAVVLFLQRPRHDSLLSIMKDGRRRTLDTAEVNAMTDVIVQCNALPFDAKEVKQIVVRPYELDLLVRATRRAMVRLNVKQPQLDWILYASTLGSVLDVLYTLKSYREQRQLAHPPRRAGEALVVSRAELGLLVRALHDYGTGRAELPSGDADKEAARRAGSMQLHDMLQGYWWAARDIKVAPKSTRQQEKPAADKPTTTWRLVLSVEQTRLLRRAIDAMTLAICCALCTPADEEHDLQDLLRAAVGLGTNIHMLRRLRPQTVKPEEAMRPSMLALLQNRFQGPR